MFQSHQYSHLFVRYGIAVVFLWLGIEKFIQPHSWLALGAPAWIEHLATSIGMSAANIFVLTGIFEILIATSLATAFFERWFAPAGALFLLASVVANGFTQTAMYDIGMIGGLLAIIVWPERHYS